MNVMSLTCFKDFPWWGQLVTHWSFKEAVATKASVIKRTLIIQHVDEAWTLTERGTGAVTPHTRTELRTSITRHRDGARRNIVYCTGAATHRALAERLEEEKPTPNSSAKSKHRRTPRLESVLLRNTRARYNYTVQGKDKLEADETSVYRKYYTYYTQRAAIAYVDGSIQLQVCTALLDDGMWQSREARRAYPTTSVQSVAQWLFLVIGNFHIMTKSLIKCTAALYLSSHDLTISANVLFWFWIADEIQLVVGILYPRHNLFIWTSQQVVISITIYVETTGANRRKQFLHQFLRIGLEKPPIFKIDVLQNHNMQSPKT